MPRITTVGSLGLGFAAAAMIVAPAASALPGVGAYNDPLYSSGNVSAGNYQRSHDGYGPDVTAYPVTLATNSVGCIWVVASRGSASSAGGSSACDNGRGNYQQGPAYIYDLHHKGLRG